MNYTELAEAVRKDLRLFTHAQGRQIVESVMETIREEVRRGRTVRLRNFGTFEARKSHGKLRAKFDDSKNFFR
jgi:nucleoid DNA-binding protein